MLSILHVFLSGLLVHAAEEEEMNDVEKLQAYSEKLRPSGSNGLNSETGWEYSFDSDCYKTLKCPQGQYCQTFFRESYFPFHNSYINRGRCVPYKTEGQSCRQHAGSTIFPTSASHLHPPDLCGPGLACTVDNFLPEAMKYTCVRVKDPANPCYSLQPRCAGRTPPQLVDGKIDWDTWRDSGTCSDNVMCPNVNTGGPSREDLETCAAHFVSQQPQNDAVATESGDGEWLGNIPENVGAEFDAKLLDMAYVTNDAIAEMVSGFLQPLWPYPICKEGDEGDCTVFPIKPKALPQGVSSYMCLWTTLHTLINNAPFVLSAHQVESYVNMLKYVAESHSCRICRNNIAHGMEKLIHSTLLDKAHFFREHWSNLVWQIHNYANEHTWATHSVADQLAPRVSDWSNPVHENPWYFPKSAVKDTWVIRGLNANIDNTNFFIDNGNADNTPTETAIKPCVQQAIYAQGRCQKIDASDVCENGRNGRTALFFQRRCPQCGKCAAP